MKKFIAGLLTGLILATGTLAFAASSDIKLKVNGQYISFPDAPPQIINGRTMVPARPLAEALGATVSWDATAKTVVVTKNSGSTPVAGDGYFFARQIVEALAVRYPGVDVRGLGGNNTLMFGTQVFTLPENKVNGFPYYSPQPLYDAGLLTPDDLKS